MNEIKNKIHDQIHRDGMTRWSIFHYNKTIHKKLTTSIILHKEKLEANAMK